MLEFMLCWQPIFTDTTKAWLARLGNDDNKVRQWWQQRKAMMLKTTKYRQWWAQFMHDTVEIFLSLKTNAHFEPEQHVTDPITWRAEIQGGPFPGPPSTKGSQSQACKWNQHTAKRRNQIMVDLCSCQSESKTNYSKGQETEWRHYY